MKKPTVTRAQIERALKAGRAAGMATIEIEIEAGCLKLRYSLAENAGEKPKDKVAQKRWALI